MMKDIYFSMKMKKKREVKKLKILLEDHLQQTG